MDRQRAGGGGAQDGGRKPAPYALAEFLNPDLPLPFYPAANYDAQPATEALIQDAPVRGLAHAAAAQQQRRPPARSAPAAAAAPARPPRHALDPDLIITFDDFDEELGQHHPSGLASGGAAAAAVFAAQTVPKPATRPSAAKTTAAGSASTARKLQQPLAKRQRLANLAGSAAGRKAAVDSRPLAAAPPLGSVRVLPAGRKAAANPGREAATNPATPAQRPGGHHSHATKPRTPTDADILRRHIQALEAKIQAAKRQQAAAVAGASRPDTAVAGASARAAAGAAAQVSAEADVSALVDQFLSSYHDEMAASGAEPAANGDVADDGAAAAATGSGSPRSGSVSSGSSASSSSYMSGSSGSGSWSSASSRSASSAAEDHSSSESGQPVADGEAEALVGNDDDASSGAAPAYQADQQLLQSQVAEEARLRRQLLLRARVEAAERATAAELRRRGLPAVDHLLAEVQQQRRPQRQQLEAPQQPGAQQGYRQGSSPGAEPIPTRQASAGVGAANDPDLAATAAAAAPTRGDVVQLQLPDAPDKASVDVHMALARHRSPLSRRSSPQPADEVDHADSADQQQRRKQAATVQWQQKPQQQSAAQPDEAGPEAPCSSISQPPQPRQPASELSLQPAPAAKRAAPSEPSAAAEPQPAARDSTKRLRTARSPSRSPSPRRPASSRQWRNDAPQHRAGDRRSPSLKRRRSRSRSRSRGRGWPGKRSPPNRRDRRSRSRVRRHSRSHSRGAPRSPSRERRSRRSRSRAQRSRRSRSRERRNGHSRDRSRSRGNSRSRRRRSRSRSRSRSRERRGSRDTSRPARGRAPLDASNGGDRAAAAASKQPAQKQAAQRQKGRCEQNTVAVQAPKQAPAEPAATAAAAASAQFAAPQTTPSSAKPAASSAVKAGGSGASEAFPDMQPLVRAKPKAAPQPRTHLGGPLVAELGLSAPLGLAAGTQAASAPADTPGLFAELLARPAAEHARVAGVLMSVAPPEPDAAPGLVRGAYASPLLSFRSYRLCPSYRAVAKLPLLSATYAHALDPLWPLCPFETAVRGECRATGCAYQMRSDYALPPAAVLQDVYNLVQRAGGKPGKSALAATASQLGPLALAAVRSCPERRPLLDGGAGSGGGAPPPKWRRIVPPEQRQQVIDAPAPVFPVPAASLPGYGGSHRGRPTFVSPALTAAGPAPATALEALLPSTGSDGRPRAHRADNARVGRYFSGSSAPPAAPAEEAAAAQQQADQPEAAQPPAAAMAEASFGPVSATAAQQVLAAAANPAEAAALAAAAHLRPPGASDAAAGLAVALSQIQQALAGSNEAAAGSSTAGSSSSSSTGSDELLHVLRLRLLLGVQSAHPPAQPSQTVGSTKGGSPASSQADGSRDTNLARAAAAATAACPGSYMAWCVTADAAPQWQAAVSTLQHGIVALATSASFPSAALQAACMLDLALRCLATWTAAGQAAAAAAWLQTLTKEAASLPAQPCGRASAAGAAAVPVPADQLPGAAARALLLGLAGQPEPLAVLWLAAANLTACGQLPSAVLHRLGQRQLAEPVDWGVAPPPASSHARVAQMLRLAVGSGVGGIHLLSSMQVVCRADVEAAPAAARARQALAASLLRWAQLTGQQPLVPARQLLQLAPAADAPVVADLAWQLADGLQEAPPQLPPAAAWAHAAALATSKAAASLLGAVVAHGPVPAPQEAAAAGSGTAAGAASGGGLSGADIRAWAELPWPQTAAQLSAAAVWEAVAAALPRCIAEAAADSRPADPDTAAAPDGTAPRGTAPDSSSAGQAWGVAWRLVASMKAALAAAGTLAGSDAASAAAVAMYRPVPQAACGALAAAAVGAEGGGLALAAAVLAVAAMNSAWAAGHEHTDNGGARQHEWQPWRPRQRSGGRRRSDSRSGSGATSAGDDTLGRRRRSHAHDGRSRGSGHSRSGSRSRSLSRSRSRTSSSRSLSRSKGRSSRSCSRRHSRSSHETGSASSWTSHSSSHSRSSRSRSRSSGGHSHSQSSRSNGSRSRSPGSEATAAQPASSSGQPEAGEIPGEVTQPAAPISSRKRHRDSSSSASYTSGSSYSVSAGDLRARPEDGASMLSDAAGWDAETGAPAPAAVVRAFQQLLAPPPEEARAASASPAPSLDEGEVRHGVVGVGGGAEPDAVEQAHAALNLAAYHVLASNAADAMPAAQHAAALAEGADSTLQRQVWREVFALAAAALAAGEAADAPASGRNPSQPQQAAADARAAPPSLISPAHGKARLKGPSQPAALSIGVSGGRCSNPGSATARQLIAAPSDRSAAVQTAAAAAAAAARRRRFAGFMAVVAQLLAARMAQTVPPLAAEVLEVEDPRLREAVCGPQRCDDSLLAAALSPVLPLLQPAEVVEVAEVVASAQPASPATAELLLLVASRSTWGNSPDSSAQPPAQQFEPLKDRAARDVQWGAWAVPLVAGALLRSVPPAPPAAWLQAVALAGQVSKSAEAELAAAGVAAQPRSLALWRKHAALQAALGAEKKAAVTTAMEAAGFAAPRL